MTTLPDELLLGIIGCATDVAGELDSNLDDRVRGPSPSDMEEMLQATMPTRRALVQVSRRLWNLATPVLYRSIIITHPHTINLLFKPIMESGERSLLFQHAVRRFHLSILNKYQWDVAPGAEELMKYLPNIKISCSRGWRHPKPFLFTALDPATSFPHLEAIEHASRTRVFIPIESITNLLHSSPNLRVFLVPYHEDFEPKPKLYAFKYLRGCCIDAMIDSDPIHYSIGTNVEDTEEQPLSQTPFPPLRSLYFTNGIHQNINRNLTRHITLLDLAFYGWLLKVNALDLSQFPQLRTLVISPCPRQWYFNVSDKNVKLREVGVQYPDVRPLGSVNVGDCRALVELVLGFPVRIQRLRLLGFALCRAIAALGLYQSMELLTWRKELEERGISLEGPDGLTFVEYLGPLSQ